MTDWTRIFTSLASATFTAAIQATDTAKAASPKQSDLQLRISIPPMFCRIRGFQQTLADGSIALVIDLPAAMNSINEKLMSHYWVSQSSTFPSKPFKYVPVFDVSRADGGHRRGFHLFSRDVILGHSLGCRNALRIDASIKSRHCRSKMNLISDTFSSYNDKLSYVDERTATHCNRGMGNMIVFSRGLMRGNDNDGRGGQKRQGAV
ncbi:MAG: hypothetical protein MJE12_10840 [Alphaproteobacteria bacterium]|nr:hypothetical protein [Alphaproteobacteria bacterium]